MKLKDETLNTIMIFCVIFMIAIAVVQRVEHQERTTQNKKLLKALDKNSKLRKEYIKQMEIVEKGQIKTNELLKYQNKLLERK